MRSKNALYNTMAAAIVQLITVIVGFILPRIILLCYGSKINGLITSVTQFVKYLYIVEMGLSGSIIFSLYKPIAEKNTKKISSIMTTAKISYNKVGLIFSLLLIIAAIFYPLIIQKEHIGSLTVSVLLLSIGATSVIDFFTTAKYSAFLSAGQHNYISSVFRIIYLVINTAIIIGFIGLRFNIAIAYAISIFANIGNSVFTWLYIRRKYPDLNFHSTPDSSAVSKRWDVIVHQISAMVVFNVPVLILTVLCSLKQVSVYSVYAMIFSGISMIVGVFNTGLSSGFGAMIVNGEIPALKNAYSEYEYFYYMLVTIAYSCSVILGLSFIKIYIKGIADINYVNPMILSLFVIAGLLDTCKIPQSTIIIAAGHYRQTRHRAIIEASVTIAACIPLTLKFGIYGTLFGSILGLLYRSIDLFYPKRIINLEFHDTALRLLRIIVLGFVIILPFLTIIKLNPQGLISWILDAAAVFMWAALVTVTGNCFLEFCAMKRLLERGHKLLISIL